MTIPRASARGSGSGGYKMRIAELNRKNYQGFELMVACDTSFYYGIRERGGGTMLTWELVRTACPRYHMEWTERLFRDCWDDPRVYGVWDGQNMAALMEVTPERALDRLRITNLYVDEKYRRQGVGRMLLSRAVDIAREQKRRAVVAQVHSANSGAIAFLTEMGMKIVGFDTMGYTNDGMKDRSFPILMGKSV